MKHPGWHLWSPLGRRIGRCLIGLLTGLASLFIPPNGQRTRPTRSGLMLMLISIGIGMAAYQSSNNLLFLVLSLCLSTLVVSGLLSWINFRKLCWSLDLPGRVHVGQPFSATIRLRNDKRWLPSYSLRFDLTARGSDPTVAAKPWHAAPAAASADLHGRLPPENETGLRALLTADKRGLLEVVLERVETRFPFGFLRKQFAGRATGSVVVWPARIPVPALRELPRRIGMEGRETRSNPWSGEILSRIRPYANGDPQRFIHWKATARTGRLQVKEMAEEQSPTFCVRVDPGSWQGEARERLCSAVATVCEDLHHAGMLSGFELAGWGSVAVRGARDLRLILDALALFDTETPVDRPSPGDRGEGRSRSGGGAATGLDVTLDPGGGEILLTSHGTVRSGT